MIEDHCAAKTYRELAQALRAQASQNTDRRARNAALRLAEEYDWRAASLEAAMALHRDVQAVVPQPS